MGVQNQTKLVVVDASLFGGQSQLRNYEIRYRYCDACGEPGALIASDFKVRVYAEVAAKALEDVVDDPHTPF